MRPAFAAATVLAAFLAVTLVAARHDARYSTALAVSDIAAGRVPGSFLATAPDKPNVSKAVARALSCSQPDILLELAAAEIDASAAGGAGDAEAAGRFEALASTYPDIPLVQYRCASFFLNKFQSASREAAKSARVGKMSAPAADALAKARKCLDASVKLDPENSLYYYETAYSYLVEGDVAKAAGWFAEGAHATRLEAGDGDVLSATDRLLRLADVPQLERALVLYQVSQCEPPRPNMGVRMETVASGLLADAVARKDADRRAYADRMLAFEDMSNKLLQTAKVVRLSQAAIVTEALVWRQAVRDSLRDGDAGLMTEARKRIAAASYRYILIGAERANEGLLPQQTIVELDTPLDMRLDFSGPMQAVARILFLVTLAILALAAVLGAFAIWMRTARQPALALVTLAAFTFLAYGGCFLSLAGERAKVTDAVSRRLNVILRTSEYLRVHGQPGSPADYDLTVVERMLRSYDYTLQAARVLAYVGTKGSFDTLIAELDDPKGYSTAEVAAALWESTGQDFGYRVNGTKSSNYEAIQAWRAWWRANRERFPEKPFGSVIAEGAKPQGSPDDVKTR